MISFKSIKHAVLYFIFSAFCIATSLTTNAQPVVTFFHNDISGSPMLATNQAGEVIWKETYRPYGEKVLNQATNNSNTNKIGFAGNPFDASTGLSYMGARYYDPVIGRFMGIDPVGFQENNIHSFNRYAYANNNPYKFVDRDGKQARSILITPPPPGGSNAAAIRNLQASNLISEIRTYNRDFSPSRVTESRGDQSFTTGEISNLVRIRDQYANGDTAGRFIVDSRGNVMTEPVGGSTIPAGRNGVDTHTTYPNGSNFQRLNPQGHPNNPSPHGHAHAQGTGPGIRGQGTSLDILGNPVKSNTPEAHFPIK